MRRAVILGWCLTLFVVATSTAPTQAGSRIPPAFLAPNETARGVPVDRTFQKPAPSAGPALSAKVQSDIRAMVGQMIVVGFPGAQPKEEWPDRISKWVESGQVGGVILFANNVINAEQLKSLVKSINPINGQLRPFVCVDQEGGAIQRLTAAKGFVGLPSAQQIGELDLGAANSLFRNSARELNSFGINVNFGPVVDLNVNPANPAIGRLGRSFGADPAKVTAYARQFIEAHKQAGIMTAPKHFPGHGSSREDPHDSIVDVSKTWSDKELIPFRDLIGENFAQMIMVGHLIHPRFSDGNLPASLSKRAIGGVLRDELGFRGLVVTDDLDMGAIRERYAVEDAAVLAIAAGADLIIVANTRMPDAQLPERIISAVIRAVADSRISAANIEESYRRIRAAKQSLSRTDYYVWSKKS
jgi:beta-N-acetylhexosaminidase